MIRSMANPQEPKSWEVWFNHKGEAHVVPSNWRPEYTKLHKATKLEAAEAALAKESEIMKEAVARVNKLKMLVSMLEVECLEDHD